MGKKSLNTTKADVGNREPRSTTTTNVVVHPQNKAWVPFSAGARSCPGQRFAMQEMITVLSCLLPNLSFEPAEATYVFEPYRDGFVQSPKDGFPMIIRQRSNQEEEEEK